MGSGKSTHGKRLAALMNLPFYDLDREIEKAQRKTIAEVFAEKGETFFRKTETETLHLISEDPNPAVISLGGGTVCNNENLAYVKSKGLLVHLDMPAAALSDRISNSPGERPLLAGLSGSDLLSFISAKLEERKKYYHSAHLVVNGLNLNAQLLYDKVIAALQENIS